jgi:hypothetical protein
VSDEAKPQLNSIKSKLIIAVLAAKSEHVKMWVDVR